MDWSPPGSSVHGILQVRILEWVAIPFSKGSFQPRNQTQVSCIVGRFFTIWAIREALNEYYLTHSGILAWRIPWTEEPGGLQSTGSQRVGHDWATSLSLSKCLQVKLCIFLKLQHFTVVCLNSTPLAKISGVCHFSNCKNEYIWIWNIPNEKIFSKAAYILNFPSTCPTQSYISAYLICISIVSVLNQTNILFPVLLSRGWFS